MTRDSNDNPSRPVPASSRSKSLPDRQRGDGERGAAGPHSSGFDSGPAMGHSGTGLTREHQEPETPEGVAAGGSPTVEPLAGPTGPSSPALHRISRILELQERVVRQGGELRDLQSRLARADASASAQARTIE